MPIRVAVAGALGRMGRAIAPTIAAQDDLVLVGGLVRTGAGVPLSDDGEAAATYDDLDALFDATSPDVLVDFTVAPVSRTLALRALERGVSPVIGATGWTQDERNELAERCLRGRLGAVLAPNFSLGAALMVRFAQEAARWFPNVEIVELHHADKRDRPSGTARLTAERLAQITGNEDIPIHSVRLRGLVAHQEVLFGGEGELLTIRHDSLSRESFAAGVLLAIRRVGSLDRLIVGLDALLAATPSGHTS
ncbi:MAG: 4-hydroxy-tetrahydrodipicolinate reductase [Candidatus Baltobacteraceae bacterium]